MVVDSEHTENESRSNAESDPLRQLATFHRRIRLALRALRDIAELPPSQVQPIVAKALVDFFRGPLLWHDIDEEAVLLPALKARAGEPVVEGVLVSCSRAHETLEAMIDAVIPHLEEVALGHAESNPVLLLTAAIDLDAILGPHLAMEEREVFPLARSCLNQNELDRIGRELQARADARREATNAMATSWALLRID